MFAFFAIWDEDKRGLFLAGDSYGIKPLYTENDGCMLGAQSWHRAMRVR
jgi:asparagine synthetase B (glutamine-hydrolysing)